MTKKLTILMMALFMLFGMSVTAFADSADAVIPVSVTGECAVELKGVSENTNGYSEIKHGDVDISFALSFDEPGEYQYEMRQVKDGASEVYDETVYNVWVSVLYENDVMQTVITGGIANTDDKPDQFKFEKEVPPETQPNPDDSKNVDPVKTGDDTNLWIWIVILAISTVCVAGVLVYHIRNRKKANSEKGALSDEDK